MMQRVQPGKDGLILPAALLECRGYNESKEKLHKLRCDYQRRRETKTFLLPVQQWASKVFEYLASCSVNHWDKTGVNVRSGSD